MPETLLPLCEMPNYSFDTFTIQIRDIYDFEKTQLDNSPNYDKVFAANLFDNIEDIIFKNNSPIFPKNLTGFASDKHRLMDEKYCLDRSDITNRTALPYFCRVNNCYGFDNDILVKASNEDYGYWFSLKLRQYDLALQKTHLFLNFQLKNYFKKKNEKFYDFLENCLDQYPDFFSERLRKSIQKWISQNLKPSTTMETGNSVLQTEKKIKAQDSDLLNVAQTGNVLPEQQNTVPNVVKKADGLGKAKEGNGIRNKPKLMWNDVQNRDTQIEFLRSSLITAKYIKNIHSKYFRKHFDGMHAGIPAINWLIDQYPLIYLFNKLKPYLDDQIYTGKEGTISIANFESHFLNQGRKINIAYWRTVKSVNEGKKNKFAKSIDLIISML
jgi:hypothetical protein